MDWRVKCLALRAVHLTGLHRIAAHAHRLTITDTYLRLHRFHVGNYRGGRALEFGGGRHFLCPLLLSHAGAPEVLVYDIERLAIPAQVNHSIRQLRMLVRGDWPQIDDFDDLERKYRIRYCAPGDARNTGLAGGSVDFVCSNSTLEHIPRDDIRRILEECVRIARPGAIFSHVVDYKDHFSYADRSVSMFNFYRYSDRAWQRWNPPNHFQNRLRHSDYVRLFAEQPLRTLIELPWRTEQVPTPIAEEFQKYSPEDLRTHSAYFVLERS
jgi:SAM-dependent methyltransferase